MSMIILKKEFDAPEINLSEVKRYMKVKSSSNEFDDLIFQCLNEVNPLLRYSICYSISKVAVCDDNVLFDNITFKSEALSKVLEFCDRAVIFSATVGLGVDGLERRAIGKLWLPENLGIGCCRELTKPELEQIFSN